MPLPSRTRHARMGAVLAATIFLTFWGAALLTPAPAASAAPARESLHVTVLGDSYSSGAGAGAYYGDTGAYRSRNSWAHLYVDWLNKQGTPTTLTNLAYAGDRTDHLTRGADGRPAQISQVPLDSDLVMLTIGGNDVGFVPIIKDCFTLGLRSPGGCKASVDAAEAAISTVKDRTAQILQALDQRLPDGARVVLVGYPRLATDSSYVLRSLNPFSRTRYDAGAHVRSLSDKARAMQSALTAEWNAAHPGLQVTYVDGVINAFDGHEPDPSVTARNPHRWINEFLESNGTRAADGTTTSTFSIDAAGFYHPNLIGHEQIAGLIASAVGVVPPVPAGAGHAGALDVAFVVEGGEGMSDEVAAMEAALSPVLARVQEDSPDSRFALVDSASPDVSLTEHAPTGGGFTTDPQDVETAVASLAPDPQQAGDRGTGGTAAQAVDLQWRDHAKKIVIVVGDSQPRDCRADSAGPAASVAQQLRTPDTVVHALGAEDCPSSPDLDELTASSGGSTTVVAAPEQLAGAIDDQLTDLLNGPSAWIQGPYVIRAGDELTVDARGSSASSGELTSYEWDLDGDGVFEVTTAEATVTRTFPTVHDDSITVRVTQSDGASAVASSRLQVTDDGDSTPPDQDLCPHAYNYGQSDYDGDGVGDECDDDPGLETEDQAGVCVVGQGCPDDPSAPEPGAATDPAASPAAGGDDAQDSSAASASPAAAPAAEDPRSGAAPPSP